MEEIKPNPYKEEMDNFKEDILKIIHDLETKISSQISSKESKLNNDYETFTAKMNSLIENNKEMIAALSSQKLKIEKIIELESFKNKVDGILITHEIRVKNCLDDIGEMKLKYDKIISDNLFVSGFIGPTCQFKNLSEYLSYNISEVSRLKMEKEQIKKEIKDLKIKMEGLMKSMITLNDKSVKLCNEYTDKKQEEYRKALTNNENLVNQRNIDMRTMIVQFQNDSNQKIKNLKSEFDKIINLKDYLIQIINEKYEYYKKLNDEVKIKTMKNIDKLESHQKNLEDKDEEIRIIKQNIQDLIFQIRNYYNYSNKIPILLEKIKNNPNKTDFYNLLLSTKNYNNNNDINKNESISSPPKNLNNKNLNFHTIKLSLDDSQSNKNNTTINKSINSSFENIKYFSKTGLKKLNIKDINSFSDRSNIIDDENKKSDKNKKTVKNKINVKKKMIENIKEKMKEKIKGNIKDKTQDKIIEKNNKFGQINTSQENFGKNSSINIKVKVLPFLSNGFKEEISLDTKNKINFNTLDIEKNKNEKIKIKKEKLMTTNNDKKITDYMNRNSSNKIDLEIKQNKQFCKVVDLSLPSNTFTQLTIGGINKKGTNLDKVNSMINNYRAELFSKNHSPEVINEMNNEILDIPKKVTQAFGRTTHNFYFKKDAIDCLNANKNINDFGYYGPKKQYNYKNQKRVDSNYYKLAKNNFI